MSMDIKIEDFVKVSVPGQKFSIRCIHSDLVFVNGERFIKLPWGSWSKDHFVRVVLETEDINGFQCSIGYDKLIALRNAACSHDKQNHVAGGLLVDSAEVDRSDEHALKRPRLSRTSMQELRDAPEVCEFNVPCDDSGMHVSEFTLKALKPVCSADALRLLVNATMLSNVIEYIRQCGFGAKRQHTQGLPKGIWSRTTVWGDDYFVVCVQGKYSRVWTVESAIAKLNGEVVAEAIIDDCDDHHDIDANVDAQLSADPIIDDATSSTINDDTPSKAHERTPIATPTKTVQSGLARFFKPR